MPLKKIVFNFIVFAFIACFCCSFLVIGVSAIFFYGFDIEKTIVFLTVSLGLMGIVFFVAFLIYNHFLIDFFMRMDSKVHLISERLRS